MHNLLVTFAYDTTQLSQNLPKVDTTHASLTNILNILYAVAGALAVVFIIVGGIRYILSAGDASNLAKAKNTILYAIAGLVIAILAFAITNFVLGRVNATSFNTLRDSVVKTLIYIAGAVAVVMIIYGAFRYVTSSGDSSSISKAKNTILYAIVGLVIVILAYAVVNFVLAGI